MKLQARNNKTKRNTGS